MIVIIEGIDRIGKSSCVTHLTESHGFSSMHFSKPIGEQHRDQAYFQMGTFDRTFKFIKALAGTGVNLVMDRGHLGETVYGPLYRKYSGVDVKYVMEMEAENGPYEDAFLILLIHDELDVVASRDDGEGFDIANIAVEQEKFLEAFSASTMRKHIINVTGLSLEETLRSLEDAIGLK